MKKYFIIALALVASLAACEKDPAGKTATPTVTISSSETFDAQTLKATVTLTLSSAATEDVKVKLTDGDIQSGKTAVPATYDATVTIAKGQTSKSIDVIADATGLKSGEYQAAIKIASAEGAEFVAGSTAYINLSFVSEVVVNLYTGGDFTTNYKSFVTVALDNKAESDITVNLDVETGATAPLVFEKSVVIPAGEKSIDVNVTLDPSTLVTGDYSSTIKIASANGAKLGTSTTANLNVSFPIVPSIVIDGDLSDWNDIATQDIVNPENVFYTRHISVKFAATSSYLYMLYEVQGKSAYGSIMSDFMIDKDGNPETGGTYDEFWTPGCSGIEWYIEQCLTTMGGGYANGCGYGLYKFGGEDGTGLFNWNNNYGEYNDPAIMYWWVEDNAPESGIIRYECWFNREFFGMTNKTVRVGFKLFDWGDQTQGEGRAPQAAGSDAYTPCDMFTVHLPEYAAE